MIPGPEIYTEFFGIRLAFLLLFGKKPLYEINHLAHGISRVTGYELRVTGCELRVVFLTPWALSLTPSVLDTGYWIPALVFLTSDLRPLGFVAGCKLQVEQHLFLLGNTKKG